MTDEKTENIDLDEIVEEKIPKQQEQQKFYLIIVDGNNVGRMYPLDKRELQSAEVLSLIFNL